ncbi:MAG: DUF1684 domain-containing protein [Ignavibacteriales bacterium]|nr:DUF1684 domain-containing protein [Ignavibacteriales bacterium]
MKRYNQLLPLLLSFVLLTQAGVLLSGCKKQTPEEEKYIASIIEQRKQKDLEMKTSPQSPFVRDSNAHFAPLKYFDVDPLFVFKSKLFRYEKQDTVITFGTKGEERKVIKTGYLEFLKEGKEYKITVYKGATKSGEIYYSLWFTDKTTGSDTYGVGRYLDFEINADPEFIYTFDFNLAYSPYCSYSSIYSCAIPTKDDYLDLEITAGEKKFHE